MMTLLISTFSCTCNEFITNVSLFLTARGKEIFSKYKLVQAGEHISHLLINALDNKALDTEITFDAANDWGENN